jgi:hypothetical protein
MPRRYITALEQQQIIDRAGRRCEYCKCPMDYTSQSFVCEHIIPVAKGGQTSLDNLALACGGCNNHKYTKTTAIDPESGSRVALYNPRQDPWQMQFTWSQDTLQIVGITATGRATVEALLLNRLGVINVRRLLLMADLHPPNMV